jgi:hypothetical protein
MTAVHADAILYTAADVFRATGISVPRQNQWLDRRTISKRCSGITFRLMS